MVWNNHIIAAAVVVFKLILLLNQQLLIEKNVFFGNGDSVNVAAGVYECYMYMRLSYGQCVEYQLWLDVHERTYCHQENYRNIGLRISAMDYMNID